MQGTHLLPHHPLITGRVYFLLSRESLIRVGGQGKGMDRVLMESRPDNALQEKVEARFGKMYHLVTGRAFVAGCCCCGRVYVCVRVRVFVSVYVCECVCCCGGGGGCGCLVYICLFIVRWQYDYH